MIVQEANEIAKHVGSRPTIRKENFVHLDLKLYACVLVIDFLSTNTFHRCVARFVMSSKNFKNHLPHLGLYSLLANHVQFA
jgi:hypothetical protein